MKLRLALQVVIRDFRYKPEGPPNVVTTYFSTHLDLVSAAVQEKFDLLQEEDDPSLIEAALQEEDFRQLLEDYFMTGDTSNAKFYKTLATLSCLGNLTLLHFCSSEAVQYRRPVLHGLVSGFPGCIKTPTNSLGTARSPRSVDLTSRWLTYTSTWNNGDSH